MEAIRCARCGVRVCFWRTALVGGVARFFVEET